MSRFVLTVLAMLVSGTMLCAQPKELMLGTVGCYKPMDMLEIINAGQDRASVQQMANEKRADGSCAAVLLYDKDFIGGQAENGMRRVMAYPYPDPRLTVRELVILFAGFSRPPKQLMYVEEKTYVSGVYLSE